MSHPTIYAGTEIRFTGKLPEHDGLGTLADCTNCEVTEDIEGVFELELTYPASGRLFRYLAPDALIRVSLGAMNPFVGSNNQLFRIARTEYRMDGGTPVVTAFAEHLSYDLNYSYTGPITLDDKRPSYLLETMLTNRFSTRDGFTFACSLPADTDYHHWAFEEPYSMREGVLKLAEEFNGEILWDNQDVKIGLFGEDRDFVVEYGGNMASFSRDADVSESATGVYIYYKDSKTYSGYSGPFTLADNPYGVTRHRLYNCADDVPSQPMSSNMEDIALAWLRRQEINPKTRITAKVTEVPEGMPIKLYDRVQVAHRVFGVYITARVVRVRYDVLRDRYKELEIGSLPKDIARTIAKMQKGAKG